MRAALALAPVALLATSCGGKSDPYAKSLAMGSEHVEIKGWIDDGEKRVPITGAGDFTNSPDRGTLTIRQRGVTIREVYDRNTVYTRVGNKWFSERLDTETPQTPAQMFRARKPARIESGLVRRIEQRSPAGFISIDFSRYGEKVSVTVPRVKGSK
jgi:hypothetical protein